MFIFSSLNTSESVENEVIRLGRGKGLRSGICIAVVVVLFVVTRCDRFLLYCLGMLTDTS